MIREKSNLQSKEHKIELSLLSNIIQYRRIKNKLPRKIWATRLQDTKCKSQIDPTPVFHYNTGMFNSLTGTITGKFPQKIFIETNGIEWDITCPELCLENFPSVGEKAKVYTYMQHTESLMSLFGFSSSEERFLFFDLLKVDGIGPKAAIKIMSNISSSELINVLESGNVGLLEKVPGIGKKTAGKMLLQLKGKLTMPENENARQKKTAIYEDVVCALKDMGYDRIKAENAVQEIAGMMKNDPSFNSLAEKEREDMIFRQAIVLMAN